MSEPTNRFVLKFNSSNGRVLRLGIPRASMTKPASEVQATMNAIIASGTVFIAGRGTPQTIKTAQRVTTARSTVIDNA